jgi:hypothetical protein
MKLTARNGTKSASSTISTQKKLFRENLSGIEVNFWGNDYSIVELRQIASLVYCTGIQLLYVNVFTGIVERKYYFKINRCFSNH